MLILVLILTFSVVSLFAIAAGVFLRFRRHRQQVSDTMLRGALEPDHSAEEPAVHETIGAR